MYRAESTPSRALADLLASYEKRLTAIERRARWPGYTQVDLDDSGITLLKGVWTVGPTLTLDPGAWLILGGVTVSRNVNVLTGFTIASLIAGVEGASANITGIQDPAYVATATDTVTVNGKATLGAEATLNLEVRWSTNLGASHDAILIDSYMIACPV